MRALDGIGGLDGAGGSGGGGDGVTSVNGDTGPAVVLDAADVGADPAGTATAAVGAHVAALDPHTQYTTAAEAAAAAPVQTVATRTGNVVLAVADVSGAAPSDSPTLTGTATSATTPANSDASTAIANTQFVANALDPARAYRVFDHFLSGQNFGAEGWSLSTNGAGASASANPTTLAGARGFYRLNAGTNATNGRSALSFEQAVSQLPLVQPWLTDLVVLEFRTQLALLPEDTVSEYQVGMSLGQGAATALTTFFNGVGLTFDITVSPNWRFSSRTAGVEIAGVDTGVAIVAAAWRYYRIEVDTVSARAYIGTTKAAAVLVATIPIASVTASVALGPLVKTYNAGIGTLATRHVNIDYIKVDGTITTPT